MSNPKKTIDVINNAPRVIGGKGGLRLLPGRNIGISSDLFAAAFYDKDGQPSENAKKLFKSQAHGQLPDLQVEEAANIHDLSPEAAGRIIQQINDRTLLGKLISAERREPVVAALKEQLQKLEASLKPADADKEDAAGKPLAEDASKAAQKAPKK